jgi:tyrosyl-tRNA synthetase
MSVSDELMWKYWTFLTDLPQSEIDAMKEKVERGELHPMQAKKDLAHAITADFHSSAEADHAAQGWATTFQQKGVADDAPEVTVSLGAEGLLIVAEDALAPQLRAPKLLQLAGLAASVGEANRKLAENAVSVNGEKFNGKTLVREELGATPTLRLGKRAVRIVWTD